MENPLAELDGWWASAFDYDGAFARTLSIARNDGERSGDEEIGLEFETSDENEGRARWRLDIVGCEEMCWGGGCEEPAWSDDHVLLARFRDRNAWVSCAKPLTDPARALGAATVAHFSLWEEWIPLERFLRSKMLGQSFGILAEGPERFVRAYAEAIRATGEDVYLGFGRERETSEMSIVTWGGSYFVARSFQLVRID